MDMVDLFGVSDSYKLFSPSSKWKSWKLPRGV